MGRQRQIQKIEKPTKAFKEKLITNGNKDKSTYMLSVKKVIVMFIVAIAAYIAGKGYLETRVNTPFDEHKVSLRLLREIGNCG